MVGNFYFKHAIQLVENVFQNLVQEKWHQFFGTDFNLLYIHAKLPDDGTGTRFCQGVAGYGFCLLLKVRESESENDGLAITINSLSN